MIVMNKPQYSKLVSKYSPKSPLIKDMFKAYLFGGTVCLFGEILRHVYLSFGAEKVVASTWVSVSLIIIAQLLSGPGIYEKIAKHAGAGLSVPITGFANAVVSPAIEYHSEGLILGLGAKLFTISGPVIVYGTAASVAAGLICFIFDFFRGLM